MFHLNTELLIDYWRGQRGERALPARSDIDPGGFARLASRAFIAQRLATGDLIFRLAGEEIVELHGRPLAGVDLLPFWRPEHRSALGAALSASLRTASPVVIGAAANTAGGGSARGFEVLFAPLQGPQGAADQFLGLYQLPQAMVHPSCGPGGLAIRTIDGVKAETSEIGLRLAAVDGRRIA